MLGNQHVRFGGGRMKKGCPAVPRQPSTLQYPPARTEPTWGRALRRSPLSLDMGSRHGNMVIHNRLFTVKVA